MPFIRCITQYKKLFSLQLLRVVGRNFRCETLSIGELPSCQGLISALIVERPIYISGGVSLQAKYDC